MTLKELKEKAKKKGREVLDKCEEHKGEIVVFVPMFIGGMVAIGKGVVRNRRMRMEERRRERDIYDPQTGMHLFIRRPLNAQEKMILARRHKSGQTVTEALYEMGLL